MKKNKILLFSLATFMALNLFGCTKKESIKEEAKTITMSLKNENYKYIYFDNKEIKDICVSIPMTSTVDINYKENKIYKINVHRILNFKNNKKAKEMWEALSSEVNGMLESDKLITTTFKFDSKDNVCEEFETIDFTVENWMKEEKNATSVTPFTISLVEGANIALNAFNANEDGTFDLDTVVKGLESMGYKKAK